jgi:acetyl esterase/lipase
MAQESRTVLTRSARPPDYTVRYGDHPDQVADVRTPRAGTGGKPSTLVIFVHGGFWRQSYDRAHAGPLADALADAGYLVATPEYRRVGAPGGGWPGTLDDVGAAVVAVPGLLDGPPPARVVLSGHSAGGHLALWAAPRLAEVAALAGVVALAPVADLRTAHAMGLGGGAVAELLGGGPDDEPDRYAVADPVSLLPLGSRLLLVHGARDAQVPIELSRRFVLEAQGAGDTVDLVELPTGDHFDVIDPLSEAWPTVLAAIGSVAKG